MFAVGIKSWEASEIKKFAIFLSDEAKRRTFFSCEASNDNDEEETSECDISDEDNEESDEDNENDAKDDCIGIARKKLEVVSYEQGIQDPDCEPIQSWKAVIAIKGVPTDVKLYFCTYPSPQL
eukprot:TRINITY_DN502_c1_g2_i1.p1 TRINITY_DN502_c1_g2~~TRINITY_DN502_c1_g2_i1.p1  ORF type:complete len:123 (+),score=32.96 TRINITY_DN502_c1_g2_i1:77-445(+)